MTRAPWLAGLGVVAACHGGSSATRPARQVQVTSAVAPAATPGSKSSAPPAPAPAAPASPAPAPAVAIGSAAPAADGSSLPTWLAPVDLQGPYHDLDALCTDQNAVDGASGACDPHGAARPIAGGTVQQVATGGDATGADCVLAFHIGPSWYASGALETCSDSSKYGGELAIDAITTPRIGSSAPHAIVLALHGMSSTYNETDDGKPYQLTDAVHGFIACGLGASPPSCTPLVVTATTQRGDLRDTDGEAFAPATWAFDARWPGDGTLVVKARAAATTDSPDVSAPATQVGTYRIALP